MTEKVANVQFCDGTLQMLTYVENFVLYMQKDNRHAYDCSW